MFSFNLLRRIIFIIIIIITIIQLDFVKKQQQNKAQ
jgi:hypothetical protein